MASADEMRRRRPAVLVEYWLAGVFGRVWLRLRPGLRPLVGDVPGMAVLVARGGQIPAVDLAAVQDFGARVWWRFAMLTMLLIFPIIGVAAVVRPGIWGREVAADIMLGFVWIAMVGISHMVMLRFRADRSHGFVRRHPADAGDPLPCGSRGLPRRSDFWVMAFGMTAMGAVLLYASSL